jgi:hypothetical protein
MPREISSATSLDTLKREAKRWRRALAENDAAAHERLRRAWPEAPAQPTLRDVQHGLAREHGLPGWRALTARLAAGDALRRYARVADALVAACAAPDPASMRIVWDYFGHRRSWDAMRRYVRLDLGKTEHPADGEADGVSLAEAQYLVARVQGFESWAALEAFAARVPPGTSTLATKAVGLFTLGRDESRTLAARSHDWDEALSLLQERRWPGLHASGQMTDPLLERLTHIDHLTALDLSGSPGLTDDGVRWLARLPKLRHLNLAGCRITDAGLAVLRRLPALESLSLAWTATSDAGATHLAACRELRALDLSGTEMGDGAIRALAGHGKLHDLRSGEAVTDAGLPALHELPVFRTWQGGETRMALLSPDARPNMLMLRGTFTDAGMASLIGLDGLFALNVDSARLAITGAGLTPLAGLPNLTWLAFDAKDESMAAIAALPHLRFLMCQDTSATDAGFVALSRSRTIEHIWGRRCHGLQRRGFLALAEMPALRHLSVSCLNVDDEGLSALPRFPSLRELMPMDVPDAGYRHVAACPQLESLVLMYCRDTTDAATEHLAAMTTLRKYFASYTRITDRTPEILSGIDSLESITFDSCAGLTNAGIVRLARLPKLREVRAESMPGITPDAAAAFPSHVDVGFRR